MLLNKALACLEMPFFYGLRAHWRAEMAVQAPRNVYGQKSTLFRIRGHFCEVKRKSCFHLELKSKTPAKKGPFSDEQKMANAAGFGRRATVCLPALFPYFALTDVERRVLHASYQSPFDTQRPSCAGRSLKQKAGGNQRKKNEMNPAQTSFFRLLQECGCSR